MGTPKISSGLADVPAPTSVMPSALLTVTPILTPCIAALCGGLDLACPLGLAELETILVVP